MFPSFLLDSYFERLMARMDTADQTVSDLSDSHDALDGRVTSVEMGQGTANGRITDLEGLADSHNTRLAALELWRSEKAAGMTKLNASGMSVLSVLGINVIGADNTKAIADKVDALIDKLVDREIIEYAT